MLTISKTAEYDRAKSKYVHDPEDGGAYYCTFEKLGWFGEYYFKCKICSMIGE